ncbi:uncharacterized protein VTP21DRAFT_1503 [Calcarisporiella thermophila]|uniref:uncharacterized protein n=1 Tax=Calcarisporiella thermophila TaxID=911321 RepID=UPI003741EA0D
MSTLFGGPLRRPLNIAYEEATEERLRLQYQNSARSEELRYRARYIEHSNSDVSSQASPEYKFGDIFDGRRYKELVQAGFFSDPRDLAFSGSTDGFQIFRQKTYECWPVILINHNLPPKDRVKKRNLLISTLIPGPKQPKDLNSFLAPLVNELKLLEAGVPCFDGLKNEDFTLRAYTVFWSGDIPAISKLAGLTGTNSYRGCRFCMIRGTYQNQRRHIYFPLDKRQTQVLRTHKQTLEALQLITEAESLSTQVRKIVVQETGIKSRSILFDLNTISFPASFPVDIMHLFFENIAPLMYSHWAGEFSLPEGANVNEGHILSIAALEEIEASMQACRKKIPTSFGRPPRNIYKFNKGYKAEEWVDWVIMYSLVFLKDQLSSR